MVVLLTPSAPHISTWIVKVNQEPNGRETTKNVTTESDTVDVRCYQRIPVDDPSVRQRPRLRPLLLLPPRRCWRWQPSHPRQRSKASFNPLWLTLLCGRQQGGRNEGRLSPPPSPWLGAHCGEQTASAAPPLSTAAAAISMDRTAGGLLSLTRLRRPGEGHQGIGGVLLRRSSGQAQRRPP